MATWRVRVQCSRVRTVDALDKIPTADMENAIEADPAICFALMVGWFDQGPWRHYYATNDLKFAAFAKPVGGIGYGDFDTQCKDLRTAMTKGGPNFRP
jgi:hypothetical protein